MSDAQIAEVKSNWQDIYASNNKQFFDSLLNISPLKNNQGAGYYQWSDGYVTYPNASVTDIVNSVSGYPEMSFWRDHYLCNESISDHNRQKLCGVQFTNLNEGGIDLLFMFNITSGGD